MNSSAVIVGRMPASQSSLSPRLQLRSTSYLQFLSRSLTALQDTGNQAKSNMPSKDSLNLVSAASALDQI
ncbi:hypothetical protein ACVIGB_000824 [Bradyrhizobium sp. USDA 4341]